MQTRDPSKKQNNSNSAQTFVGNLPRNAMFASLTVPSEGLAIRRIFNFLDNPSLTPPSYVTTIKKIGVSGLFAGGLSRVSYCLVGNYATLLGIDVFGADPVGIVKGTIAKNAVLPFFLLSNARQTGRDIPQTVSYMVKGIKDPTVHGSFFFRNLVGNSCLVPGFTVRDYYNEVTGHTNTTVASLLGYSVSLTASTVLNSYLKPFFTGGGIYSVATRRAVASKFPAAVPLAIREAASIGLIFYNSARKVEKIEIVKNENNELTMKPRK